MLLDAGRPLSRSEIFEAIPAYRTGNPSAGERKFERDKKDLRELGVPLEETDPDEHTYAIDREAYELPPVQLDEEERSALLLAAEAVRGPEGLVYRELIDEALRKLSFERPAGAAELPANLAVTLPPRRRGRGPRKLLADLTRAAETQKRVHMTYVSDRGELTERAVDPYALLFRDGEWSLVGHCHLRDDQRTFRVDRIRGLKVAPRPATPDFVRPADWSLAQVPAAIALGVPGGRFAEAGRRDGRRTRPGVDRRRAVRRGRAAGTPSRRLGAGVASAPETRTTSSRACWTPAVSCGWCNRPSCATGCCGSARRRWPGTRPGGPGREGGGREAAAGAVRVALRGGAGGGGRAAGRGGAHVRDDRRRRWRRRSGT